MRLSNIKYTKLILTLAYAAQLSADGKSCKEFYKLIIADCLKVKRKLLVCGNAEFGSNIAVTNNATIGGNLIVEGNETIGGNLIVEGNETIGGDLAVEGNTIIGGNLFVAGNEIIEGNLIVENSITTGSLIATIIFTNSLIVEGTITASGLNICDCTLFVDCPNNRVGINTCSPTQSLDVVGTATFSQTVGIGGELIVTGSEIIGSNLNVCECALLVNCPTRRVGINTCDPQTDLDVSGSVHISDNLFVDGTITTGTLVATIIFTNSLVVEGTITASGLNICNCTLFVDCPNNRVGINTCNPTKSLDVVGTATFSQTVGIGGELIVTGSLTVGSGTLYYDVTKNRLGVNTLTPRTDLDVIGSTTISGRLDVGNNLSVDTNVLFVNAATNRVGINTSSPTIELDVVGSATIRGDVEFQPNPAVSPLLRALGNQFLSGLRVIRGSVVTNIGTKIAGEGFTVSGTGNVGKITIVFDQPFTDRPIAILTPERFEAPNFAVINAISQTQMTIYSYDAAGALESTTVAFCVIGP